MRPLFLKPFLMLSLVSVGFYIFHESLCGETLDKAKKADADDNDPSEFRGEYSSSSKTNRRLNSVSQIILDSKSIKNKPTHGSDFLDIDPLQLEEMLSYCSQHNQLLSKRTVLPSYGPAIYEKHDFSLTINDYKRHHHRVCDTTEDILHAVATGIRKWDSSNSGSGSEK